MSLSSGTRLGPYEILAPLGAGGMGEVYRATDTKLGRQVAIKVLPAIFAHDADRMARFQREAQVLASLNHPNIAAIYGVEENALVMELVEGQTLKEQIERVPIPLADVLVTIRQISEALEYAHEKGVIHRDLKPANVKITPEGVVKVLDFGLAKIAEQPVAYADPANSPTLTMQATEGGMILGTAAYMSPEQAGGQPVDKRSDIWSFGVVLFEMLSGQRLFKGETLVETLASIVRADIDWTALPAGTPPVLMELAKRCLERKSKNRLRDIGEARILLERLIAQGPEAAAAAAQQRDFGATTKRRHQLTWAVAGAAVIASLIWALAVWRRPQPDAALPAGVSIRRLTSYSGTERDPAISPDGRHFAYVSSIGGQPDIWVRQVSGGDPVQLTRDPVSETELVYGPDGESIYYSAARAIWRVGSLGGTPSKVVDGGSKPSLSADGRRMAYMRGQEIHIASSDGTGGKKICDAPGFRAGFSLSPDARRVAFIQGGLFEMLSLRVVDVDGSNPRKLMDLGFGGAAAPAWLPDSRTVIFARSLDQSPIDGATDLWMMPIFGGPARRLTLNHLGHFLSLRLSRDGKRLLASLTEIQREVWKAPLGPDPEANGKAAQRLLDNSGNPMWIQTSGQMLLFSGNLTGTRNLWAMPLDGTRAASQVTSLEGNSVAHAALSPDGTRVAFCSLQTGNAEIWTMNTDGSNPVQLTRRASADYWPAWTADGKWLAFGSEGPELPQIWKMPSSGGEPVRLTRNGGVRGDWSPVANRIVYSSGGNLPGGIFLAGAFAGPILRLEVADFEGNVLLSVKWPSAGSALPVWSPDGRRFTAIRNESPDNDSVWIFDAATGEGKPAVKFPGRFRLVFRSCWTADGQSVIVNRSQAVTHIVMVENLWQGSQP